MARSSGAVGLQDVDYDPEIHGEVDFEFFVDHPTPVSSELHSPKAGLKPEFQNDPQDECDRPSGNSDPKFRLLDEAQLQAVECGSHPSYQMNLQCHIDPGHSDYREDSHSEFEEEADISSLSSSDDEYHESDDLTDVSPLSSKNHSPFIVRKAFMVEGNVEEEPEEEEPVNANSGYMANEVMLQDDKRVVNDSESPCTSGSSREVPKLQLGPKSAPVMPIRIPGSSLHRHRRYNMSFTNDEVMKIDHENQLLLKKILKCHQKSSTLSPNVTTTVNHAKRPSSGAINRGKEQQRIEYENLLLLKKIQAARPSTEVEASGKGKVIPSTCGPQAAASTRTQSGTRSHSSSSSRSSHSQPPWVSSW